MKLGKFYELLKTNHQHVITKLRPLIDRFERQGSVKEAVEGQSQINTSVTKRSTSRKYDQDDTLCYIVIDGSNVAMEHGNDKIFSCKGIQLCVDYYREKGHKKITVYVPGWCTRKPTQEHPISDPHILNKLKDEKCLVYTQDKKLDGKHIVCDYTKYILNLAVRTGGIVVSNDSFKDLKNKHEAWGEIVRNRVTGYCIVDDYFMPPDDPYGKDGPHVDKFLQKSPPEEVTGSSSTSCMARDQELQAGPASSLNKKNAPGKRCRR